MHSVFASDKDSSGSKSKNGFVRRVFSRHHVWRWLYIGLIPQNCSNMALPLLCCPCFLPTPFLLCFVTFLTKSANDSSYFLR
jgi:hypothetical protein